MIIPGFEPKVKTVAPQRPTIDDFASATNRAANYGRPVVGGDPQSFGPSNPPPAPSPRTRDANPVRFAAHVHQEATSRSGSSRARYRTMWNQHQKSAWDIRLRALSLACLFLTGMSSCPKLAAERLRPQDLENDADDPRTELEKFKRILKIETERPKPATPSGGKALPLRCLGSLGLQTTGGDKNNSKKKRYHTCLWI